MVPEDKNKSTSLSLLERVKGSDDEAWQRLVGLHAPMIYARCRQDWKLTGPDAENVGQDVFAAIVRSIGKFERQRTGSFRKWIRTITDNKCRDYLRKNPLLFQDNDSVRQQLLQNLPDGIDESADSEIELRDRALMMRQAIGEIENEFSSRDLEIFWNAAIDERASEDIASRFDISVNVVYIVCSRIKKRLRETFQDLLDDDLISQDPLEFQEG